MDQTKGNYVEYVLFNSCSSDDSQLDVNLPEEQYLALMRKLARAPYKYFGKQCKVYYHNDLVYENYNQEEIKTYSKALIDYSIDRKNSIAVLHYSKDKVPFHNFPATSRMNAVSFIKKITFRVHNRIYINFQMEQIDGEPDYTRKVYINYNHDTNLDAAYINDLIERCIMELVE